MQASYTLSRAIGDGEDYLSPLGDDPAVRDRVRAPLDYDQRHVVKLFASTHLPKRIVLGGTILWSSGTPFSDIFPIADTDDAGNGSSRLIYAFGGRNTQRNGGEWSASARAEKGFSIQGRSAEAYVAVDNLLNGDDVVFRETTATVGSFGLRDFRRRFGR